MQLPCKCLTTLHSVCSCIYIFFKVARVFIDKKSYNFGLGNVKAVKMEEGCEPCQRPEYRSDVGLASFNLGQ